MARARVAQGESYTNAGFVRDWASQLGSAHSDPDPSEKIRTVAEIGLFLGGEHVAIGQLRAIAETVLYVGRKYLSSLDAG